MEKGGGEGRARGQGTRRELHRRHWESVVCLACLDQIGCCAALGGSFAVGISAAFVCDFQRLTQQVLVCAQQEKEEAEARLKKFSVDYSRFDSIDDSDQEVRVQTQSPMTTQTNICTHQQPRARGSTLSFDTADA